MMGNAMARGLANIPTAQERQQVHVTVGVDPNNGSVKPYVDREIGRNNAELVGAGSGANTRAIAGGGSLR
jgi:hypothetical protein